MVVMKYMLSMVLSSYNYVIYVDIPDADNEYKLDSYMCSSLLHFKNFKNAFQEFES